GSCAPSARAVRPRHEGPEGRPRGRSRLEVAFFARRAGTIRPVTQAHPSSIPAPPPRPLGRGEGAERRVLADDARVPLRLRVRRGGLGRELYEPVEVGPLTVSALALTLPNLKFPVDLSGGVARFRHRRGDLERLKLELAFASLTRFATPRLKSV